MPLYGDVYRPDFQAQIPEIEWMPEEEQQMDFSPLASALKRRFARKPQPQVDSRGQHLETEMTREGHGDMEVTRPMAKGIGGGGKMSL